jgi:hypothetical protein
MTTAADRFDDAPSPTDLQHFVYLANNGIAERNSPEHRLFRSSTSGQALQPGVWSKSNQLEEDHPIMSGQSRKVIGAYWPAVGHERRSRQAPSNVRPASDSRRGNG